MWQFFALGVVVILTSAWFTVGTWSLTFLTRVHLAVRIGLLLIPIAAVPVFYVAIL